MKNIQVVSQFFCLNFKGELEIVEDLEFELLGENFKMSFFESDILSMQDLISETIIILTNGDYIELREFN